MLQKTIKRLSPGRAALCKNWTPYDFWTDPRHWGRALRRQANAARDGGCPDWARPAPPQYMRFMRREDRRCTSGERGLRLSGAGSMTASCAASRLPRAAADLPK